jgi:putative transcriptional regulator
MPISNKEISSMREKANLSQAAFARCLNLTQATSRSWSTAPNNPKAQPLALLNVIRRKGFDSIL